EAITIGRSLDALAQQRSRVIDLAVTGVVTREELSSRLARIESERTELERRVAALRDVARAAPSPTELDLLDEVRARLDGGLADAVRHEIVRLLVRVRIVTYEQDGKKRASARVAYRFPEPAALLGVVATPTDPGSSPPRA